MPLSDAVRTEVERILRLDLTAAQSRTAHTDAVTTLLNELDCEIAGVIVAANGYPGSVISAAVWMDGAAYANVACALTRHFHAAGWLEPEEAASALWARATLAVCAHYRHMVGPAMLANADCHERLGDTRRAAEMYDAVVKDFECLVNEWDGLSGSPIEDDRVALESLRTALQRSLALVPRSRNRKSWSDLLRRTNEILARPNSG